MVRVTVEGPAAPFFLLPPTLSATRSTCTTKRAMWHVQPKAAPSQQFVLSALAAASLHGIAAAVLAGKQLAVNAARRGEEDP